MKDPAEWDKALADADDPNVLEPQDFDDSAAWAQMTALHWHLVRSLGDLRVETASPDLFKDGTAFASSRITEKTASEKTYTGKCAKLAGLSWGNRYFAMVVEYGAEEPRPPLTSGQH